MLHIQERKLSLELNSLRMIGDQYWKQKAKVNWLKYGNRNTSFFHVVASGRRRTNLVLPAMIPLDDNVNATTIRSMVSNIFKQRFQCSLCPHISAWFTEFSYLNSADVESLETLFSKDEVFRLLGKLMGTRLRARMAFFFDLLSLSGTSSKII